MTITITGRFTQTGSTIAFPTPPPASVAGDTAVFMGGFPTFDNYIGVNTIDTLNLTSLGNASATGVLSQTKGGGAGFSNGTTDRGIHGGGVWQDPGYIRLDEIEYVTITSAGNSAPFGLLSVGRNSLAGCSNGTNDRGVFVAGIEEVAGMVNTIEYITISSTGNVVSFGEAQAAILYLSGTSDSTNERGIIEAGWLGGSVSNIWYITISNEGNSVDFGNLTTLRNQLSCTSNATNGRAVFFSGGPDYSNVIDYITISSLGNTINFGDLSIGVRYPSATSDGTGETGFSAGGFTVSPTIFYNFIDYITISSAGNSADFGDLSDGRATIATASNGE